MAHYAFIDENNIVVEVITGRNEGELDIDWERYYGEFRGLTCKRTSYNTLGNEHLLGGTPFRKNYAGIGYKYDSDRDAFIPPQPYPSWSLDEFSCQWKAPKPKPEGKRTDWDEVIGDWVDVA